MVDFIKELNGDTIHNELMLEKPKSKPQISSRLGRFFENCSYFDILFLSLILILISSLYFSHVTVENGLGRNVSYLESLYFSFVTFTTLGYGDLTPKGFGRVVSVLISLAGLLSTALVIGKFSSERQQAMLLLLHTSDCERRIADFSEKIKEYTYELELAVVRQKFQTAEEITNKIGKLFEACSNYVIFHANQSRLTQFGNDASLITLYRSIERLQEKCISVYMIMGCESECRVASRTYSLSKRCYSFIRTMYFLHDKKSSSGYFRRITDNIECYLCKEKFQDNDVSSSLLNIKKRTWNNLIACNIWIRKNVNSMLLEEVLKKMPHGAPVTWKKNIGKIIGEELGVSNKITQECIKLLRRTGKLPK